MVAAPWQRYHPPAGLVGYEHGGLAVPRTGGRLSLRGRAGKSGGSFFGAWKAGLPRIVGESLALESIAGFPYVFRTGDFEDRRKA